MGRKAKATETPQTAAPAVSVPREKRWIAALVTKRSIASFRAAAATRFLACAIRWNGKGVRACHSAASTDHSGGGFGLQDRRLEMVKV